VLSTNRSATAVFPMPTAITTDTYLAFHPNPIISRLRRIKRFGLDLDTTRKEFRELLKSVHPDHTGDLRVPPSGIRGSSVCPL